MALFLAPWGSGLITHNIVKLLNLHMMGDSTAWNSHCEKCWLFRLLPWRSIKSNVSWKSSWKVCQLELNWGPTILGKYLYIFVLPVFNSINHSRGLHGFYPSPISQIESLRTWLGLSIAETQPNGSSAQNQTAPRRQILMQHVGFREYFMQSTMVWLESRCLHWTVRNKKNPKCQE